MANIRSICLGFTITVAAYANAAMPGIGYVRVNQDRISFSEGSYRGMVEFELQGNGLDTFLVALQLSDDDGATWTVPLSSDFFFKLPPATYSLPFTVSGNHGGACKLKITLYDSISVQSTQRFIPAKGHVFFMGSNGARADERPRHGVGLTHDFWIDTTETSEKRFKAFKPDYTPEYSAIAAYTAERPLDNCYWHWAVRYCNWRSRQEGLDTCYSGLPADSGGFWDYYSVTCNPLKTGYRLPTEAEWEYACRGGCSGDFAWGDDSSTATVNAFCWSGANYRDTIHGPALLAPNRFGLYDMPGSMLELCNDWYDSAYYRQSPVWDPQGPLKAAYYVGNDPFRVTRGGHFLSGREALTNSSRIGNFSSARHPQSFRCVRTISP